MIMPHVINAKYHDSHVRLAVSSDQEGTIMSIDNFPMHTVVYLDNDSARQLAEKITTALNEQDKETA